LDFQNLEASRDGVATAAEAADVDTIFKRAAKSLARGIVIAAYRKGGALGSAEVEGPVARGGGITIKVQVHLVSRIELFTELPAIHAFRIGAVIEKLEPILTIKIAADPITRLHPNLGICESRRPAEDQT